MYPEILFASLPPELPSSASTAANSVMFDNQSLSYFLTFVDLPRVGSYADHLNWSKGNSTGNAHENNVKIVKIKATFPRGTMS